jgi:hypothetical protein
MFGKEDTEEEGERGRVYLILGERWAVRGVDND